MKLQLFVFIQIQQERIKLHQLLPQLQIKQVEAAVEVVLEEEQPEEIHLKELKFFHKMVQKFLEQT